ncbi:ATP-binding protein [Thermodesulfobacteriota bacterium]
MNIINNLLLQIKPKFLESRFKKNSYQILFNYKSVWLVSILLLFTTSLVPMSLIWFVNYKLSYESIKTENHLRTIRLTSNARRTITFFLEERLNALMFVVKEEGFEKLNNREYISDVLRNLQMGFGGFVDIGLINSSGVQIQYKGPFVLEQRNYRDENWFTQCVYSGVYVSDVFMGYRNVPHMIIAVGSHGRDGTFYILRATLDLNKLNQILSSLELSEKSDAFLCNRNGLLQTPTKYYGKIFDKIDLPIPEYSTRSQVIEANDRIGNSILIGYAYIKNSPFILMLIKRTDEIMKGWYALRNKMVLILSVSGLFIIIVILAIPTYMVNKIYDAEQTRVRALQRIEHTSRLASIGSLAAGVAHEINNPLAIISENVGYLQDLFSIKKEYKGDKRLNELISDVLESVDRCGEITKNLLGFAREVEPKISPVQIGNVIDKVLKFLRKEASYRNIELDVDIPEEIPLICSDFGKLQQIFLNLITNAFQAMDNGGSLKIRASLKDENHVTITLKDNGCGISEGDLKRLFEPFFTTKISNGGTGLGLSITYGLVHRLNGDISVRSKVGKGTTVRITLPIKLEEVKNNECSAG